MHLHLCIIYKKVINSFHMKFLKTIRNTSKKVRTLIKTLKVRKIPQFIFVENFSIKKLFKWTFIIFLLVTCCLIGFILIIYLNLPDVQNLTFSKEFKSSIIYDSNGNELFRYYNDYNLEELLFEDYPQHVFETVLSAEDKNFYEHDGIDWIATLRCSYYSIGSIFGDSKVCGASTITQQVSDFILSSNKNSSDSKIIRKAQEMLFSLKLENKLNKNEILELYVNQVPLGGQLYGFPAASSAYFRKKPQDITYAESALLAGMISSPTQLALNQGNTFSKKIIERKDWVIDQAYKNKYLTKSDYDEIISEELVYNSERFIFSAPHFSLIIKQIIENESEQYHETGLKITSTLDSKIQEVMEESIDKIYTKINIRKEDLNVGSIWINLEDGSVRGLVGSSGYTIDTKEVAGSINVFDTKIQAGSTIKPPLYFYAFKNEFLPSSILLDSKSLGYNIENPSEDFSGITNLRESLYSSRNISTRYLFDKLGRDNFLNFLENEGVNTKTWSELNNNELILGQGEINLGQLSLLYLRILSNNNISDLNYISSINGDERHSEVELKKSNIIPSEYLKWILCNEDNLSGQLVGADFLSNTSKEKSCLETGISGGNKDNLAISFGNDYLLLTWIGKSNKQPIEESNNNNYALQVNDLIIQSLSSEYELQKPISNNDIVTNTEICLDTGKIKDNIDCKSEKTIYDKTLILEKDIRKYIWVCKTTNKLASNYGYTGTDDFFVRKLSLTHNIKDQANQNLYNELASENGYIIVNPQRAEICNYVSENNSTAFIWDTSVALSGIQNGTEFFPGMSMPVTLTVNDYTSVGSVEFSLDKSVISNSVESYNNPKTKGYQITINPEMMKLSDGKHVIDIVLKDLKQKIVYTKSLSFSYITP